MYAIIRTGSKQYRVKPGDVIDIERISQNESSEVVFDEVLLLSGSNAVKVGTPTVNGALVKGELIAEVKDQKLIVFKYKKRKNCRTKNGHRQKLSRVKITEIVGGK